MKKMSLPLIGSYCQVLVLGSKHTAFYH